MSAFYRFIESLPAQVRPTPRSLEYKTMRKAFIAGLREAAQIAKRRSDKSDTPTDQQIGASFVLDEIEATIKEVMKE